MLFLLLLLSSATAFSQTSRDDLWREDVNQAVSFVQVQHPALFTNVTREKFSEAQTALLASIPRKSDAQVVLGLQGLLALARDGHTAINLFQARAPLRRIPLRFYWFADGIFVTDAGAAYVSALGAKLLRIEDAPVEDVVSKLAAFVSHENEWWVRSQTPVLLTSPEALFAAGVSSDENAAVRLTLLDAAGRMFTLSVEAAAVPLFALPQKARPNPPLYRRYPERFYWFEYIEPSGAIYVKYNSCQNSPVLSMTSFVNELASLPNPVTRAVIDLRNNGGGDSSVIRPLTDSVAQALAAGLISKVISNLSEDRMGG
ncbi:MAG: hypothetical protein HYZ37_00200 [Candidatus Solibacter usitatus]|nr:hypothetical protein [Candidatus Solibacter usitatus]